MVYRRMRKPPNIQVLKRKVDGVDGAKLSETWCLGLDLGQRTLVLVVVMDGVTEVVKGDDRGRWMATMTTMAVMAAMTSTTTMMKMRRTADTGRCCASDLCRGIGGAVDGDMDATFVVSTKVAYSEQH
jgi:hypothetical protein